MMATMTAQTRRSSERPRRSSARWWFVAALLCALWGHLSALSAATPPAVVEDWARAYISQKTMAAKLTVQRDLLNEALRAPRLRNANNDAVSLPNLQNAAIEFRAICAGAERDWLAARVDLWTAELARFERSGQPIDGAPAAALHWSERIGWWCGPPAVVLLVLALLYDSRHALRRALGNYASLAVVLFLGALGIGTAMTMSTMLRAPAIAPQLAVEPPHDKIAAVIAGATRDRAMLESEVDQLKQDLADSGSPGDNEVRRVSRELAECAAVHAVLLRHRRADVDSAADLAAQTAASVDEQLATRIARAAAGLSLALLAVIGAWIRNRVAKKMQARRAATCPACGHKSGLRIDRKSGIARCGAAACGFDLLLTHCRSPRLRLTVLGPAGSGKTHWLSAAARELTAGHYLVRGSTTPSAATTTMEQVGGAILDERRPPAPTAPGTLPLPMVLRDRDPLGRSDLLVTVSESASAASPRSADGFILTIDATQPLLAHRKWLAELAAGRAVRHHAVVFALTKIDLLSGREMDRFFADLAAIEPTGRTTSRGVIRRRSERTARFVSVLWPGWDAAADLGRRDVPWFPVTPVGLNEPGEHDLRRRVIEPFATLEPLLGLMHACGYPMLA
jgi:hypothetical protein